MNFVLIPTKNILMTANVLFFIYNHGHFLLLMLLLLKAAHILLCSDSYLYSWKHYLWSYDAVQLKNWTVSGSKFEILQNALLYSLLAGFVIWILTIVMLKILMAIIYMKYYL